MKHSTKLRATSYYHVTQTTYSPIGMISRIKEFQIGRGQHLSYA